MSMMNLNHLVFLLNHFQFGNVINVKSLNNMKLVQNGQDFTLANLGKIPDKLSLGTYTLLHNDLTGQYYLHQIEDIKLPKKIYGDLIPFTERVCTKFDTCERNLGVLLVGTKGGGKTLLSKLLANKLGYPVIIIPEGYDDQNFISFVTDPALGNCVILIDEFDKLYNNSNDGGDSNKLLSLLDGPYNTHHLFCFTCNEFTINSMLKNRPSRIHFLKEFTGLDEETVIEIGNDLLDNKNYIEELVECLDKIVECTYDVIISICEDCNLYKESPKIVLQYLNVLMESQRFDVYAKYVDKMIYESTLTRQDDGMFYDYCWIQSATKKDEDGDYDSFKFQPDSEIPSIIKKNEIIYDFPEHKVQIILKKQGNSLLKFIY